MNAKEFEKCQIQAAIDYVTDLEKKHTQPNLIARLAFEKGFLPHVVKAAFKALNYVVTTTPKLLIIVSSPLEPNEKSSVAYMG